MSEINRFGDILRRQIREDMNNYTDDLANGVCRSFDEYQKLCGVIRGLAIAEQHLATLMKKVEESDE
jgi:hypothetical protein